ncbi:TonB-linked outer membrane protein, SusC/RagA family [Pseudarcicella hirudinis]|uniref:TonB-linked outer membrane protein, SusC/RagA family n=1 Tax=Pseudarcicella hirudinis TaxID=1079859 RepID=A0A1I5RFS8_9BACT|nr:TonB-dependent receptor [Pseudarcicella hirudinis]SFP57382.1 TonB-linked outer membrane protein, SusC/RagA family [Pseudarcicella hirudinis]
MKNYLLTIAALFLTVQLALAQQRTITGRVLGEESNEALIGANILIKGTTRGTTTNAEGKFSLSVPENATTLMVSYIGYASKEVSITGMSVVNISLVPGKELNEVVVVGYTSSRKEDLTGAVAIVDLAPIKNISSGNPMQALQGRVPGLYIEKSGSPNGTNSRILIRGANTLGNTDPLYIIDGVPTKRPEVLQGINPNSIQSIQVLKDASAASIYGSRASNGVIIVTTKNGTNTNGKINIDFNSSISFQSEKYQRFKMLNAVDRGKALWQASVNDGVNPEDGYGALYTFDWNKNLKNPVLNGVTVNPYVGGNTNMPAGDTDWQEAMYKMGVVTNNELTITGGTKNSSLQINLGYFKNTGMLKYTNYDKISGRINALTSTFNNSVKIGANIQIASSNETLAASDIGGALTPGLAITLAPTIPIYAKDGSYGGAIGSGYSDRNNPLHMQDINKWDNTNRLTMFGNVFIEIEPVKNLFFKSSVGADNASYLFKNIEQSFSEGSFGRTNNSLTLDQNKNLSLTWSNTVRYNLEIGRSQFKFLAGVEAIKNDFNYQVAKKEGFALQTEDYFVLSAGTGNTSVTGSASGSRLLSQFGRIDYGFSDKYLAAVTIRRDGSSRFGEDNRYGIFPAASVGWRIDKEDFFKDVKVVSNLKARVGVGRVGNQEIGDLARYGLYDTRYGTRASQVPDGHNGFFDQFWNIGTAYDLNGANTGNLPSGFVSTQAENTKLKWETTDEVNAGIDFGFFDGSLVGSFDYFTRTTSDILIKPPVASAVGEGQLKYVNGATKVNNGFELSLGYYGKPKGDLTYSVFANFSRFRDKITELPEEVRSAYAGNAINTIIGHSQFDLFGYKTNGLFQSQAEVDAAPKQVGAAPGRIRYVDTNNDGVINDDDRVFFGTSLPALEYSLTINLGYKNFDLSVFGSGIAGRTGFDSYTFYNNFIRGRENVGPGVFDAWTPTHTNTRVPALSLSDGNNETRPSDYFNVNTSYFKLRNVQLGYTFSKDLIKKIAMERLRVYVMAENLFLIKSSQFIGPDPERTDVNAIPIPRTLTFGVNVSF